jgi:hypothetical protein
MQVIVDNLDILPVTTNFREKGFVFSKNKNMPIKRVIKAKMKILARDRLGWNNPFFASGLCFIFRC